jgi:hypothetical protein
MGKKPSRATVPLSILTAALLVGPVATVGDTVADVLLGYAVLPHPAVEVPLRTVRAVQLIYTTKTIFVLKLCLLKGMKSSIIQYNYSPRTLAVLYSSFFSLSTFSYSLV